MILKNLQSEPESQITESLNHEFPNPRFNPPPPVSNFPVQPWWQSELALVRAFLARFFDNEVTAGSHDLKASLFWLIALLAMPGAIAPILIGLSSLQTTTGPPDPSTWGWAMTARYAGVEVLRTMSRADKTLYLGFAMVASALISAITWTSVMPAML